MEQDLKMEKIILTKFGIAPQFKNRNISIRFSDSEVPNTKVKEHKCLYNNVRFSLVDNDKKETIFTMDFYEISNPRAFGSYGTYRLDLIYIHDPFCRRKGIGTFYINKLKKYVLENKGTTISLIPNPNTDIFKNNSESIISQQELIEYYKLFEDENIKMEMHT